MEVSADVVHPGGWVLAPSRVGTPDGLRVEWPAPLVGAIPAGQAAWEVVRRPQLLQVAVQPLISLERATVAGYECLARCPAGWNVGPVELFRAAARLEFSAVVQGIILERVIRLRDQAPANTFLTVNLEPADLLDDTIMGMLVDSGDLSRIVIEVTERDWPEETAPMVRALDRLRDLGALVALDDAGAGHSDLARLMTLRPEMVKLDRDLINDVDTNPRTRSMISLMGELCDRLDAWVLVEGVERVEQLRAVAQLGVPLVQGHLLAPPARPWPTVELGEECQTLLRDAAMRDTVVSLVQPPQDPSRLGAIARGEQMSMAPQTRLVDALRRALNRPESVRYEPVVITDGRGRILGEVQMDRLMLAVADRADLN